MKLKNMLKENMLKENPDSINAGDMYAYYRTPGAHAFGFYNGKVYIGDEGRTHYQIKVDLLYRGEKFTPDEWKKFPNDRSKYKHSGRLWMREKLISFWNYPVENQIKNIISKLEKAVGTKMWNNGWRIEIIDKGGKIYRPTKKQQGERGWGVGKELGKDKDVRLIPLEDYQGSQKQGGKELSHQKSPLLKKQKKVPMGVGSRKKVKGALPGETPAATRDRIRKGLGDGVIKLKDLLLEKTFKIGADVNYVYKAGGFEKFIKAFERNKDEFPEIDKIRIGAGFILGTIESNELKSMDAKKADLVNPVNIFCGAMNEGSYYMPKDKIICISFNRQVLSMYADKSVDRIPQNQLKGFNNEITEHRIKTSISHELSHWISDSLYNSHIGRIINRAQELGSGDILKLGKKDVNMTYFEIDAQIHGIKALKSKFKKEWDQFTLRNIFEKYTALNATAGNLYRTYGQDILDIWQKLLLTRMAREKLLGKNMRKFVQGSDL
jgi:hypothetical protein